MIIKFFIDVVDVVDVVVVDIVDVVCSLPETPQGVSDFFEGVLLNPLDFVSTQV